MILRAMRTLPVLILLLAACQPADEVLPTVVNLDDLATQTALEATANAPTATPTSRVPTLPPTFTPTIEPTATETATPELTVPASAVGGAGTIVYLYNGDSIVAIAPDGSYSELIVTFGVGRTIQDLSLAPDGQRFAYVAPGSGSAREVYISNADATITQQISCLGYADTRRPVWSTDGQQIAFFSAPAPLAVGNLYRANVVGRCPSENAQGVFLPVDSPAARDYAWNRAGDLFFYSVGDDFTIYVLNLETEEVSRLSLPTGFGADFSLAQNPVSDRLAYITTMRSRDGRTGGGVIFVPDSSIAPAQPFSGSATFLDATRLSWSVDGSMLLISATDNLYLADVSFNMRPLFGTPLAFPPVAAINPDGERVAYVQPDERGVDQIYILDVRTRQSQQLSAHPEGRVTEILWMVGAP